MDLSAPLTTLEDLAGLDPSLERALRGTSRQFFEPECPNVYFEVGRKPFYNATLQFIPNQPVSRAWDVVFRVVLAHAVNQEFGHFRDFSYDISPQADPALLVVEVGGPSSEETKRFATTLNFASAAANAVVPKAASACLDEHARLAKELGLARPRLGF